jgi:hypothetical protein
VRACSLVRVCVTVCVCVQASCAFTLALIDPKEMIKDGPQGPIPCGDAHCPVHPPPPTFNGSLGYCAGPPPPPPKPPSAACQKKLDAYCQNTTLAKACYPTTSEPTYKDYAPLYARDSFGCSIEPAPGPTAFRLGRAKESSRRLRGGVIPHWPSPQIDRPGATRLSTRMRTAVPLARVWSRF